MTQIGSSPILVIRMLTRIARRIVNGRDAEHKLGIKRKRNYSPEVRARYEAAVAENKRLQVRLEPRLDVFRDFKSRRPQRRISLARSDDEIAASNRALLVKAVAAKAEKAAAKARKSAIDAVHPKRETHQTSQTERWKDRVRRPSP